MGADVDAVLEYEVFVFFILYYGIKRGVLAVYYCIKKLGFRKLEFGF